MKKKETQPEVPYTGKAYLYIAIALEVLCAVSLGLIATVLGIYALIASIILGLAALAFCNIQKKRNNFALVKYFLIAGYILTAAAALLFVGGIIWSAVK